jgi:hypothetical protein
MNNYINGFLIGFFIYFLFKINNDNNLINNDNYIHINPYNYYSNYPINKDIIKHYYYYNSLI